MLNKETVDRLQEINLLAKREMARIDTDQFGTKKIDISTLYKVIDAYEQANNQLIQSSEFREAVSTYADAQDSAEGAISALQQLDYSVDSIEPILTSSIVTESVARLKHEEVTDTSDPDVNKAIENIIDNASGNEHKKEIILGYSAIVANYLATKAMEKHDSTDLTQNQQAAIVFIIMLVIAAVVTQGLVSIPIAMGGAGGFKLLHDAAQDQADELDLTE